MNSGIAGVTAISSIPYLNNYRFSYGIVAASYSNGQAIASGFQLKYSERIAVRVNISLDSYHNSVFGAGFGGGC
ncbi:YadA-like family protein [Symbiopectobacterium purcellii]|uniref:YadA-like family protein n=1 Tax=Symbiopectobacterium purcellii TaxID=2871826 RepID=UPI003F8757EB